MSGPLAGRRFVVSAGPTYEDIDPVRFLGNRSSGKMGFAIASEAAALGAAVRLVAGPVRLPTPAGVERFDVRSAAQMHAAVMAALDAGAGVDGYIGAAAVADFTPRAVAGAKLKKQPGQDTLQLELVRTRDILADVAAHPARPRLVVGFAAETEAVAAHAREKRSRKRIDMICANRVGVPGSGFEADDNALLVIDGAGEHALGPASKPALARDLLAIIAARLED